MTVSGAGRAQQRAGLETAHPGHLDVAHDGVGTGGPDHLQGSDAMHCGTEGLETLVVLEPEGEELEQGLIVVNDQDGVGRQPSHWTTFGSQSACCLPHPKIERMPRRDMLPCQTCGSG